MNWSRLWRYWKIAVNVVDSRIILKVDFEDVASVRIIGYAVDIEVFKMLFSQTLFLVAFETLPSRRGC